MRSLPSGQRSVVNLSGIKPTGFNVLVKQKEVELKIGSIHIPETARDKQQWAEIEGTLIEASPLAFNYDVWPAGSRKPEAGDRVVVAKYSGVRVRGDDGQEYLLMNDKDISAIRV